MKIEELALSDARILNVEISLDWVAVKIEDWREEILTILFVDICGIEAFTLTGIDLDYAETDNTDSFFKRACVLAEKNMEEMNCYIFWATWDNKAVLKIVARKFSVDYS